MMLVQQKSRFMRSNFTSDFFSRSSDFFRRLSTSSALNREMISQSLVQSPSAYSSIEIVDLETWLISSSLSHSWSGRTLIPASDPTPPPAQIDAVNHPSNLPDPDEIDDMKIRGNLFFKILKNSKEYEENRVRFTGIRNSKNQKIPSANEKQGKKKIKGRSEKNVREIEKNKKSKDLIRHEDPCSSENHAGDRTYMIKSKDSVDVDACSVEKKPRVPSFNKLAAPYHYPFCLDIFTSKKSVRACVVHRVTNKVVVVAHSISKDLKSELESRRGSTACVTVGAVLAQRALADDIHNVVYTPRNGEIIEGKIRDVLRSIVDNGVSVKIKLKQRGGS